MFTDASDFAYGGFLLKRLGKVVCYGRFTDFQSTTSSTVRELLAIKYCLESFASQIRHESINVRTDNENAAKIITIGSKRPHLQDIAVDIFDICVRNDIRLHPKWIPREQNIIADRISKMKDADDWSIDNETFLFVCQRFGHPSIDRFADNLNAKLPVFNTKFYCPGTCAVDAFTQDWSVHFNWLNPPVKLIPAVIRHARLTRAQGILHVPCWPSSHFWPLLHDGRSFRSFVEDWCSLQPTFSSFRADCIFNGRTKFSTVALKINCT